MAMDWLHVSIPFPASLLLLLGLRPLLVAGNEIVVLTLNQTGLITITVTLTQELKK